MSVRVNPNSSRQKLVWKKDWLKVNLTSPPEQGRANEELLECLADRFQVSNIEITSGTTARTKQLKLTVEDRDDFLRQIQSLKG